MTRGLGIFVEFFAERIGFEPDITHSGLIADQHTGLVADVFRINMLVGLFRSRDGRNVYAAFMGKGAATDEGCAFVWDEVGYFVDVTACMCQEFQLAVG